MTNLGNDFERPYDDDMPLLNIIQDETNRESDVLTFQDLYGADCSIQQSSLAEADAIWIGCDDPDPHHLVPGKGWQPVELPPQTVTNTRMHLTRDQVAQLLPILQRFVDTGELKKQDL